MTDIYSQLSELTWRGIGPLPIVSRDWEFVHEHSRHRFLFQREQLIEALGGENPPYRYTIPFLEDIARGPYKNLFTVVYPQFLAACLDESDGILDDPFHGPVQVKCAMLREITSPDTRDGIHAEVSFIVSPDDDFERQDLGANLATLEGARDVAGSFDEDVAKIDWQQEPSPEPTVGLFDAITSVANQVEVAANKPFAAIEDAIYRYQRAEESIARLRDPVAAPARAKARRLQLALLDQRNALGGALVAAVGGGQKKRPRVHRVESEIGIISLAGKLGMSFDDFLRLNPAQRGRRTVAGGQQVLYLS